MDEENCEDWSDQNESNASEDRRQLEIQKMFMAMERKAKNHLNYMLLEGFIERTDEPDVYKYTPEGLVLAHQKYKKLRDEGLL